MHRSAHWDNGGYETTTTIVPPGSRNLRTPDSREVTSHLASGRCNHPPVSGQVPIGGTLDRVLGDQSRGANLPGTTVLHDDARAAEHAAAIPPKVLMMTAKHGRACDRWVR